MHVKKCVFPGAGSVLKHYPCVLRLALAGGLKSRGGWVDASLSSEGCFKLHCTHSVDVRFTGSPIQAVIHSCTSSKCTRILIPEQKHAGSFPPGRY